MTRVESSVYDFQATDIAGKDVSLRQFQGNVLLIVNVASRCAFTKQYTGLQSLYEQYHTRGFAVLGFPCNQFGAQEPKSEDEIGAFCSLNYNVSFPMFSKVEVNGADAHPLFVYLKSHARGFLGSSSVKWNFTKFLVDRQGKVFDRYSPSTSPHKLAKQIERLLER